ncbi:MAG: aldo/keto reductase [Deltaproteobacteria bacterium]|nr:aldo/keto reductase [Deltaproteobacteria bacterium]
MEYRRLGRSGLKVSALSFGAWVTFAGQLSDDDARKCMAAAYDSGVNFFDNAEAYARGKAEEQMGRALKALGWRRESYVLSTKIFWGGEGPNDRGLSHKHVIEGVNAALKRLGVEYVDLCFCHRPDPETPIEETVRAMDILVRQGKVFYWGTSEWSAAEIALADGAAQRCGLARPAMEQPQYNMLVRDRFEKEYTPIFRDLGIGTTVWSPLASGLLSGKYDSGIPKDSRLALSDYAWLKDVVLANEKLEKVRRLAPLAKELGATRAQLALAWCLKNPNVSSVITGASKLEQVQENMKALEVLPKLNEEVMKDIESILGNDPNADEDED